MTYITQQYNIYDIIYCRGGPRGPRQVLMKRAAKEREREERASILASYSADVLSV